LKRKLKKLIRNFKVLKTSEEVKDLAKVYIEKRIFPERYIADALHAAITSFHGISYLVSWNFEHLVKVKTRKGVNSVNMSEGFREIEIVSPPEL